ncbi:MAG: oligosaccharide flippase family protein [Clostridia bacterium]|nr:oligosaccharide flippase family protein [Clostridia bacterium]
MKALYKSAIIVTIFSVAERFLGFIYRIFLSRNLGAEGVGVYQVALSVFGVLITITASGIPITVSRLIIKNKATNNKNSVNQTISSGIFMAIAFSLPITLIFVSLEKKLEFVFSDTRCLQVLLIIMPTLVINSIYAVIRGSFWGDKSFFTYALIEFLEELVMLVCGIMLILHAKDTFDGVKKASVAVLVSYLFSFTLSIIVLAFKKVKPASPFPQLKPLISSAMPITAMRTTTSIISSLIAIILPARLIAGGLSSASAMASYGEVSGMAMPLLFMPSSLIGSIALVLVPELSESFYKGKNKALAINVQKALKYSILIACLIIPIFISLGPLIGETVYSNLNAGKYLSYSAVMMLPMSINLITTSMLNSINCEKKTLLYYFIGESGLILSIYFLPKFLGANALILGYYFSFTISSILNLILLEKKCKEKIGYKKFLIFGSVFILPSSLLGVFLKNILILKLPNILVLAICCLVVVLFNLLFYFVFDFIDIKMFFKKRNFAKRNYQNATHH